MAQGVQGETPVFHTRPVPGGLVVSLTGPNLTVEMGEPLYRLVEADGHRHLVLNFEAIRFLSSAPIGVLANLSKKAGSAGGSVRLCRVDPDIREILRITRTAGLFSFFDDERDAVASIPPG